MDIAASRGLEVDSRPVNWRGPSGDYALTRAVWRGRAGNLRRAAQASGGPQRQWLELWVRRLALLRAVWCRSAPSPNLSRPCLSSRQSRADVSDDKANLGRNLKIREYEVGSEMGWKPVTPDVTPSQNPPRPLEAA